MHSLHHVGMFNLLMQLQVDWGIVSANTATAYDHRVIATGAPPHYHNFSANRKFLIS